MELAVTSNCTHSKRLQLSYRVLGFVSCSHLDYHTPKQNFGIMPVERCKPLLSYNARWRLDALYCVRGRKYIYCISFNDSTRQFNSYIREKYGSHLAEHCKKCACVSMFANMIFLRKEKTKMEGKIVEACYRKSAVDECISCLSLNLHEKGLLCLTRCP